MKPTKASAIWDGFIPNPKLKLLDQVSEVMRFKHYSLRTEQAYRQWIKRFMVFHRQGNGGGGPLTPALSPGGGEGGRSGGGGQPSSGLRPPSPVLTGEGRWGWRHPRDMGPGEIRAFLSHLASERDVAVATQNQALNALVFLYREVLRLELGDFGAFDRPSRPARLPVVLTGEEAKRLLAGVAGGTQQLMARLLYGTGLRLMECVRLRVKDVDFAANHIVVREGKGFTP